MSVTFAKDATSVELPGPAPGGEIAERKQQAVGRTVDGQAYAYDKGTQIYETTLALESLSDSEKSDLVSFFHDDAEGVLNTFTYTDSRGTSFTARFTRPDLVLKKVAQNVWDVTLTLELTQMAG